MQERKESTFQKSRNGRYNVPLGTCHRPPFAIPNLFPATSTMTLPEYTKKHMCIFLEFFDLFTPPGGTSTIPVPKKGILSILAYLKEAFLTSRVSIARREYATSYIH
jgi:hypothetical protein